MIDLIDEDKLLKTDFKKFLIKKQMIARNETARLKDLLRDDEFFSEFEHYFSTFEIMNRLIYSNDELIYKIEFLTKNSSFIGLKDEPKCIVNTYSQLRNGCFSIQCSYDTIEKDQFNNFFTNRNTLLKSTNKNTLLRITLNQAVVKEIKSPFIIFIYETNLKYIYKAITQTSISLTTDAPKHYDITYQRFENIRLPPPYSTSCLNYFEKGFRSRNHKIEACINEEIKSYADLKGKVYFGNVINKNKVELHFDIYRQHLNLIARKEIQPILNQVFDKCANESKAKECYSQIFLPSLLKQRIFKNDSNYSVIQLLATTLPEIKSKKLNLVSIKY